MSYPASRARREAAKAAATEHATELGHSLGNWWRIGNRMDGAICQRCSRLAYVAVAARTNAIITGGTALEGPCPGE